MRVKLVNEKEQIRRTIYAPIQSHDSDEQEKIMLQTSTFLAMKTPDKYHIDIGKSKNWTWIIKINCRPPSQFLQWFYS